MNDDYFSYIRGCSGPSLCIPPVRKVKGHSQYSSVRPELLYEGQGSLHRRNKVQPLISLCVYYTVHVLFPVLRCCWILVVNGLYRATLREETCLVNPVRCVCVLKHVQFFIVVSLSLFVLLVCS